MCITKEYVIFNTFFRCKNHANARCMCPKGAICFVTAYPRGFMRSIFFLYLVSSLNSQIIPHFWRFPVTRFFMARTDVSIFFFPGKFMTFGRGGRFSFKGFFFCVTNFVGVLLMVNDLVAVLIGGIAGVPNCVQQARLNHSNLANIWLGSIPHKLIFFALERYGVPTSWISLIRKYYISLWSKLFSLNALSNRHQHLKGIFADCTVSIILFLAGMNVIIEYTNTCNAPNFVTSSKTTLPLIRPFMDDIDLMSEYVSGVQMMLSRCSTALKWAGIRWNSLSSCLNSLFELFLEGLGLHFDLVFYVIHAQPY